MIGGTHIYFDKETNAGGLLFYQDTGFPSAALLIRGYAKVGTLRVAQLNNFIITSPSHVRKLIFNARGKSHVLTKRRGWCTVSAFTCVRFAKSHAVGALRYRVKMDIANDIAEGNVCWVRWCNDKAT